MAALDGPAQGPAFADEPFVTDQLVEGARAHPGRKWLALARRHESGLLPGL
jgi:hypothetical protein